MVGAGWVCVCTALTCGIDAPLAATLPVPIAPAVPPAQSPAPSDWTTYHHDSRRTGYLPGLPDPRRLSIAWSTPLDGAVYAEPLVVNERVLVATENDSIYSLDAETGRIVWHTRLGTPVPLAELPCGNIDPLGITGTPVYDPAAGLLFAVAEVTGPAHVLVGLDVRTGEVRLRRSADSPGMTPGAQQQRAALALFGGRVYVAFGGLYGDCGDYHGWVVASATNGRGPLLSYRVPTARRGGIWAPPGPVIDETGDLYVSVGNGAAVAGRWDHSDSVLRLSPTLALQDAFAPARWRSDNLFDRDLGSLAPVLLPDGQVFIAGKSGVGYLLRGDTLGGVGGEQVAKDVCHAYGGAAVVGTTVFLPCNEGLQQIEIGPGANFRLGWRNAQVPGSPVVGGRTVYAIDPSGTLYALEIETGKVRASVSVGATSRFATPTLYRDRIFVGTMEGITAVAGS